MGLTDVVKGMLLWVETTEERERRNLSLELEQTHPGIPTNGTGPGDSNELVAADVEQTARS